MPAFYYSKFNIFYASGKIKYGGIYIGIEFQKTKSKITNFSHISE